MTRRKEGASVIFSSHSKAKLNLQMSNYDGDDLGSSLTNCLSLLLLLLCCWWNIIRKEKERKDVNLKKRINSKREESMTYRDQNNLIEFTQTIPNKGAQEQIKRKLDDLDKVDCGPTTRLSLRPSSLQPPPLIIKHSWLHLNALLENLLDGN